MVDVAKLQKEFEELANTTTSDISAIIKSEVFAKLIVEEATKGRLLAGVIAASQEDLTKGDGDTVKVRVFPKISVAQTAEGAANEAGAYKPFASTVTINRYSVTVPVTAESLYEASVDLQAQIVNSIALGWADKMDEVIVNKLDLGAATGTNYVPAYKAELATAGDLSDVYEKIKDARDGLRKKGWNPDTLVIGYDVAQQLIAEYESNLNRKVIQVDDNGNLKSVYGLKVIVTPFAPDVSATANEVVAVVLDSSVAVVEARGMPAKFSEKYEPEYDLYKEVFNAYWGVDVVKADLDGDSTAEAIGIAQVVNPSA
ncbi:MAG: phage major capsid protein [Archaeoglobus sp.]|uniref:phage major capsid protein n=1 Tax=Archaeoglobus sp. TaxID=1872626 RepID=UPI001DD69FF0|nr:phage major capsid protein [Archaeoglobus sp.]MBO8180786.1 phage major capsid protein [Archaeoglobus sp.]